MPLEVSRLYYFVLAYDANYCKFYITTPAGKGAKRPRSDKLPGFVRAPRMGDNLAAKVRYALGSRKR